ncbi:N-acetylmuramoyl-L-alanine amidase [Rubrobacter naiadicus]|uniref:golvesin C-terminal-like domain-containing protein n=1 Tax=Rubrobacter naiadicus TaxID=1392641 RepID=UPI00235FA071|nr:N-acetylmuramoyl-L-alanine amidase [Rubrobacter naiadicus]
MGADYPYAGYYPASTANYTPANRPTDYSIDMVIIHVTQGSWSATINWFENPAAQSSAHYVVRSSDGYIGQSVLEKDIAWHAGNWYYNEHSVGIEHEGYIDDPSWFTDVMYRSSARLTAYLCEKYKIAIDRQHIIGHDEVPDPNNPGQYGGADHHKDPGPYWNWDLYMSYVAQYAGSATSGGGSGSINYKRVIDNADDTTSGRFSASGNWRWSSWNPERYYWNYRFTTPKAVNDTAKYRFDLPQSGSYDVYAWWPANRGYNNSVPIGVLTTSGWRWVRVNQRKNGGRWNHLGTFDMPAGDQWNVLISRWTAGKGYIIADAIKIVGR